MPCAFPSPPSPQTDAAGSPALSHPEAPQTCPGDPSAGRARSPPEGPRPVAPLPDPGPEPENGTVRWRWPSSCHSSLHVGVKGSCHHRINQERGGVPCWGGEDAQGPGGESDICFLYPEERASTEGSTAQRKKTASPSGKAGGEQAAQLLTVTSPLPGTRVSLVVDTGGEKRFSPGGSTAPA